MPDYNLAFAMMDELLVINLLVLGLGWALWRWRAGPPQARLDWSDRAPPMLGLVGGGPRLWVIVLGGFLLSEGLMLSRAFPEFSKQLSMMLLK